MPVSLSPVVLTRVFFSCRVHPAGRVSPLPLPPQRECFQSYNYKSRFKSYSRRPRVQTSAISELCQCHILIQTLTSGFGELSKKKKKRKEKRDLDGRRMGLVPDPGKRGGGLDSPPRCVPGRQPSQSPGTEVHLPQPPMAYGSDSEEVK